MNCVLNRLIVVVTLLALVAGSHTIAVAAEPATDVARGALQKRDFPWYDSAKDQFRPLRSSKSAPRSSSNDDGSSNSEKASKPEKSSSPEMSSPIESAAAPVLNMLMWGMLAAFLVGVLIIAIIAIRNRDRNSDPTRDQATATVRLETLEALPEPTRGVVDLLAEAARLASQSQFAAAMTFYYSWQLVQLDQQHLVEVEKGKTNRQYAREVRNSRPELNEVFHQSIRLFEDAFFGNLTITAENFRQVWDHRYSFKPVQRRTR